ncbi:MAG: GNAT family N-acetyltransferase [Phycisphaerae bacterium]|nr:GNAT family N-acetyltransferase [Phycisphaerae bacterium]
MKEENLKLIEPSDEYRDDFLAMAREYLATGVSEQKAGYQEAFDDFPAYVRKCRNHSRGIGLPEGWVPATTYWLVRNGRTIVSVSNLRHSLTDHLEHEGGQIGYNTRPSERGKGYGSVVCALTLRKAGEMGMKHILITCDTDNLASARIIEKNGGKLENQTVSKETGKTKNRYWIDL